MASSISINFYAFIGLLDAKRPLSSLPKDRGAFEEAESLLHEILQRVSESIDVEIDFYLYLRSRLGEITYLKQDPQAEGMIQKDRTTLPLMIKVTMLAPIRGSEYRK